ncbi:hypothetical protein E308F_17630 [Moorella sp. E308F]|uniref:DUF7768 domain-containing protein n=1 Tax=unclassified Neomoorella TaxID=2676739 RepID=UPI0010FFBB54|nr:MULTISPECIES: DUF4406 domain-containing protein [unclassified Moorella (in: firmicutes)]GEA15519.1 hypothetical protein E308F_17630 [Moorella sp. E308F]GEA19623.1 hypothetical protein E306M_27610 [Moorella sp. E306M]
MQNDLLKEFEDMIAKYGHIGSTSTYFGNLTPEFPAESPLVCPVPTAIERPKLVYVAHPFADDPEGNKAKAAEICRRIAATYPGVVPICPILVFGFLREPAERRLALMFCLALVERCDELWLAGEWEKSGGCWLERQKAQMLGMPIIDYREG